MAFQTKFSINLKWADVYEWNFDDIPVYVFGGVTYERIRVVTCSLTWMLVFNSISMLPFIFWWPFIRFHFLSAAIPKFYLRQTVIHRNLYLMLIQRTFLFLGYFFWHLQKSSWPLNLQIENVAQTSVESWTLFLWNLFLSCNFSLLSIFFFANKKKNISILIELMLSLVFVWNSNSLTVVCVARYLGKKH